MTVLLTKLILFLKIDSFSNYKFIQLDRNSGTPAKPRNLSIDLSKKYIMFIDGDDWLPEDALEKLYTLLKQTRQTMLQA